MRASASPAKAVQMAGTKVNRYLPRDGMEVQYFMILEQIAGPKQGRRSRA